MDTVSDAKRGPLLAVALVAVLAEDGAQDLADGVDAQLAPDGHRLEELDGARLPQETLEGEGDSCEALGRADLVVLAGVSQGQLLAGVHADRPETEEKRVSNRSTEGQNNSCNTQLCKQRE